ncbi:MAG TPA: contractile injection system protein, VgrG/Pvc8 family [Roseiflexaceae bacterium]|nr:contractile injection system protein, VgrG/Pvc8 family [Roseiflexaceae bacterium]
MAEAPVSESAIYSARPTVRLDTRAYPLISELILGMRMTESEGGLSSLELRLSNWASDTEGGAGLAFEDDTLLKLGAALAIYAGDELAPQEIFSGTITGLEAEFPRGAAPELVVLAEDALQQLRLARRTKTYEDQSVADIVRWIAREAGLTATVDGFADNPGTQVQLNESDLAFLRRLLARYGGDLQVVGRELHIAARDAVQRSQLTLCLGGQLREARALADLAQQVTEITAGGWDALQGTTISASSTGAATGPGGGRSGATALHEALGARRLHLGHLAAANQAELQAMADAAFDQRARRFVCVEGTAEGNPQLRVGSHVLLEGLGPRFSNTYYVTRVCHRYDLEHGYETDFEAECAFLGEG